jgi:hypothetical protein
LATFFVGMIDPSTDPGLPATQARYNEMLVVTAAPPNDQSLIGRPAVISGSASYKGPARITFPADGLYLRVVHSNGFRFRELGPGESFTWRAARGA